MVIGNVLYRTGQHAKAEPYFREVLRLNPTHTGAMNNLGAIMQPDGDESRLNEALAMYERALLLPAARQDKALLSSFGALLCRPTFQRYQEAAALFEEAVAIDPHFEVAKKNLEWVQQRL